MYSCSKKTLMSFILSFNFVFSQTGNISGTVIEESTGRSLPGANVIVKEIKMGAASDADGNFLILKVPAGSYEVEAQYLGYKSQRVNVEVSADGEAFASFELKIDPLRTEEVVVTGIASKTSKAVAQVAVQRLNAVELRDKVNYTTIDNMLMGKIAGVSVQKGEGNFGASFRMNVRSGAGLAGTGQPVYYVDGIKVENTNWRGGGSGSGHYGGGGTGTTSLIHLDPNDIESIEVIKGPAGASSYGTSGSNGVVLITTKRGKLQQEGSTGRNWGMTYRATTGYHDQPKEYELNGKEIRFPDMLNNFFTRGPLEKHAVSVTGGTKKSSVYFSMDQADEQGITPRNNLDQNNVRTNIDFFPSDKFNLRVGAQFNRAQVQTYGRERYAGMFAIYSEMKDWYGAWGLLDSTYFDDESDINYVNTYIGSIAAEWTPYAGSSSWLSNVSARLTIGLDDKDNRNVFSQPPRSGEIYGWGHEGSRTISQRHSTTSTYTGDVRYVYDLSSISAISTVGFQAFDQKTDIISAESSLFDNPALMEIEAGNNYSTLMEINNNFRSAGIFTEHSFSLNDTYFSSFMVRQDYASVLGSGTSSIIYPRASFAIRVDRLGILPETVSFLKLRAAYGETGILPGRIDAIPTLWGTNTSPYGVGGVLSHVGNPDIKPERIKEFEAGIEAEAGPFAIEFTTYKQWAFDGLVRKSLVGSSGQTIGNRMFNLGEVEGTGYETQLMANFAGKQAGGWSLNLSTTFSYQENTVTSLGGGEPVAGGPGGGKQYYWEGMPKLAFYNPQNVGALISDGTNVQQNGDHPMYGEVMPAGHYYGDVSSETVMNADGTMKHPDGGRIFRGTGTPDYIGSASWNLQWKGFSFYGMFQFKTGMVFYNESRWNQQGEGMWAGSDWINTEYGTSNPGTGTQDYDHDVLVSKIGWGDTGTGTEPLTPGSPEYIEAADEYAQYNIAHDANFIEPGDFVRLQELSLSYNMDKMVQKSALKDVFKGMNVGVRGSNLWLKTDDAYHGFDPEINSMGFGDYDPQNAMQAGTIPPPKTWSLFVSFAI